jgi:hypothetical protein
VGEVTIPRRGAKREPNSPLVARPMASMVWLNLLVIRAQGSMKGVNRSAKTRRGHCVVSQRNFRTRKIS